MCSSCCVFAWQVCTAVDVDVQSFDSSEDDWDFLETVDLPEKVVNDQAEMTMTPPQSAEWGTDRVCYLKRHIYTIHENEDEGKSLEVSSLSFELREKRALYQLALCSLRKKT